MGVYVYLVILMMLFVVILLYNCFSPVFTNLHGDITDMINESNSTASQGALDTLDIMSDVWKYAPVFFLFALILWGVTATQKRETQYYYR